MGDSVGRFCRGSELVGKSQEVDCRSRAKRQRILETKATELDIGVDHLWTWFKSLRDMFTRQVFMFEIIMDFIYLPYT